MSDTKSLPTGQPVEFTIARCEVKKALPAKDDQKPATIYKLGLIAPDGSKDYAELFVRDGQSIPGEGTKETLILTSPDNPAWALKAARPRAGGGAGRGGGRSPANDASIEAQVALKAAIEWGIAKEATADEVCVWTAQFAEAIRGAKP